MMILVESKQAASKSSVLNTTTPEETSSLSFSELLKGADKKSDKALDGKGVVLALDNDEKDLKQVPKLSLKDTVKALSIGRDEKDKLSKVTLKDEPLGLALSPDKKELKTPANSDKRDALISLLKGKETSVDELKNALATKTKSTNEAVSKEFKTLIVDAKDYLKAKLAKGDEYNKVEIKDMKKSLKGITSLAQKIGVDIVKASIEEVKVGKNNNIKNLEPIAQNNKTPKHLASTQAIIQDKENITNMKNPKNLVDNSSSLAKTIDKLETYKTKIMTQAQETSKDKKIDLNKQVDFTKPAPLASSKLSAEQTIEQVVTPKQLKTETKSPKEKADETLKMLLRGDKTSEVSSKLTPDFSVATAKVIAPSATTDLTKNLEKLLHGESASEKQSDTTVKTEASGPLKADSFEVKLNEAKQMIKYISQDVKAAIQDYKSPFTRVKIQLNPQRLGEVDLTIVQRGKNLHVNISSNNTAINALSMNANELKTQLNSNGINNATLNFNNSSQNTEQNNSQQQNRQNERKANEEYGLLRELDETEANEEIMSSLEIVVANYA
ncbi:MAG: flagellar hook-length control protein FliK [Sulfurimonas sp.]|jgi:flagellar hook-length control protein FliK